MSKRVVLSIIRICGYVETCFFVENLDCWLGMSRRVVLSKIRICGYVKTCLFVENPDFWVCLNVFCCRKYGFLDMSKHVFLTKIRTPAHLDAPALAYAAPRVVFAKGARTACGSAGNAIKFAREAKM